MLHKKPKLGQANDSSNDHSKSSEDKWKVMKFYHFPKGAPHGINTALEEEQRSLLSSNNELVEQWLIFEKDNNDLRFYFTPMII